jgi:hypothetical protein
MTDQPAPDRYNLYRYQVQAFPLLLGWAAGSLAAGLAWLAGPNRFLRGLGVQFAAWGLIDGLIALLALKGARKRLVVGAPALDEHDRQALQFEKIVWANAVLDVFYVLGGVFLLRRAAQDGQRRGMGWGVILQGGFLLIWDILLAGLAGRRRRAG